MIINLQGIKIVPLLVAILFFLRLGPYFVWPYVSFYFTYGLTFIISCFFFINRAKISKDYYIILIVYIIGTLLYGHANHNMMVGLFMLFMGFIAFSKESFCSSVYNSFMSLYSILIGLGVLSWLLVLAGVISPIGTIETISDDAAKQAGYVVYPFTIMVRDLDAIRFRGMFDEPGIVGSVGAVLLCINNFNFKDWRTYPVLISGILAFSFFFYIILFVYFSTKLIFIKKKIGYFVLFVILGILVFAMTKDNDIIYELLWKRFEWDADSGGFVGDNRMGSDTHIAQFYESIKGSHQYWFGVDNKKMLTDMLAESSSYRNAVMYYGMFFFVFYCLFFILYGFKYNKNIMSFLLYCFVFLGMVYQRPGIYEPVLLFLFTYYARHQSEDLLLVKRVNLR